MFAVKFVSQELVKDWSTCLVSYVTSLSCNLMEKEIRVASNFVGVNSLNFADFAKAREKVKKAVGASLRSFAKNLKRNCQLVLLESGK